MSILPWILLFLPLLAAAANQLYLKRNAFIASMVSTGSVVVTFLLALVLLGQPEAAAPSLSWLSLGQGEGLRLTLELDRLAKGMMVIVTGIGMLVHIFSLGYMADDPAKARYFTGLSFFMFSMTGVVLAGNFIMTFIFWELVGLSSYLLIGHWYRKAAAADAANKAFIVNRIGDFGFMVGILLLFGLTGTFVFDGMKEGLADFQSGNAAFLTENSAAYNVLLGTALVCVFCGAVGKSAQMPLHVWLPDAMEGPTPISALIHAATMVAAGIYMLFRVQLSLGLDFTATFAGDVIAWVGGITALVSALMATQQNDIKRILAYSTLSQLGYMVMATGLGGGEAGMFHLYTHAWFKALLFLGAGAVIFACHHEQDIWKMGGLLKKMPISGASFIAGTAALIAVPFTSGFFSKEAILHVARSENTALFWLAVVVAVLTPFYMTRLLVVAFLGKPRTDGAGHAREVKPVMWVPLAVLGALALVSGFAGINGLSPAVPQEGGVPHFNALFFISFGALVAGVVPAFLLYRGRDRDPLSIPLFRERFYIDALYDRFVVRGLQNGSAAIVHFFDEFVINGLIVGGAGRLADSLGLIFRRVQNGNLQAYAFTFGTGVILVIYFTTFWK